MIEEWLLDTGWACGWIKTRDGVIVDSAPIFRKLIGQKVWGLPNRYKYQKLESEVEE